MIRSKQEYRDYLEADKIALNRCAKRPRFMHDIIWKYERLLRKCEYYENCRRDILGKIYLKYLKMRFVIMNHKLGFSIPLNVFEKGLSIAHYGTIVVNANARIGEFCRIHEGVTIGVTGADYHNGQADSSAQIGNRVFIATGAKIIGRVKIADGVSIGANAVVVKDILEPNTTWAGVPARKVSNKGSEDYIFQ